MRTQYLGLGSLPTGTGDKGRVGGVMAMMSYNCAKEEVRTK
ncbi:hypothetical protein HmCmsJML014_03107 [Escherichia coli]|nr:hypothetical protein HmCmsJML014_03107 [Escherichia coli]